MRGSPRPPTVFSPLINVPRPRYQNSTEAAVARKGHRGRLLQSAKNTHKAFLPQGVLSCELVRTPLSYVSADSSEEGVCRRFLELF